MENESDVCEAHVWQAEGGLTEAALLEVFAWLGGAELARAGAVCRAWRAAAAAPALWRRLLARAPGAASLDALYESREWRSEYVNAAAPWELRARLSAGAPLVHAALAPGGARLALATDDAAVLIWERTEQDQWRPAWSRSVRARGWRGVARAEWPRADSRRLLLAGPLAAARRWELLVLQQQEREEEWCVVSRAGCSAGAGGCWAGGAAFVALELRQLGAAHYATTVWLNAATQETQSEYAGVTTPLLRVYNEDKATITHVAVAEAPLDCAGDRALRDSSQVGQSRTHATLQTLVCGFSGTSGALRAWGLSALQPPPLLATGDLRSRAASRRAARRAAAADPDADAAEPELDEAAVRAMCIPHEHECRLPGPLVGLVIQTDGRCAWACTAGARVTCVALPALRALRCLAPPAPDPAPALLDLHYVHPAVSDYYIVAYLAALQQQKGPRLSMCQVHTT
ncbi:F-box/WD repeat-containing protein 5-like [Ostrinia nubilalis]|uniref:F-box/WD repeat-containing protein 5-like n=1 Tax=Ostrinia nubilalis TaxID=29057 RepID=UPI0030825D2E